MADVGLRKRESNPHHRTHVRRLSHGEQPPLRFGAITCKLRPIEERVNNFRLAHDGCVARPLRATNSSGPNTGFEIIVPGRQDLFARRILIPLAGAPISFEHSLAHFFFELGWPTGFAPAQAPSQGAMLLLHHGQHEKGMQKAE